MNEFYGQNNYYPLQRLVFIGPQYQYTTYLIVQMCCKNKPSWPISLSLWLWKFILGKQIKSHNYKLSHSSTEKCYLKSTGQFDKEKRSFNHGVVLGFTVGFTEGFTRFSLTLKPAYNLRLKTLGFA